MNSKRLKVKAQRLGLELRKAHPNHPLARDGERFLPWHLYRKGRWSGGFTSLRQVDLHLKLHRINQRPINNSLQETS
jgi:hypothetical protein